MFLITKLFQFHVLLSDLKISDLKQFHWEFFIKINLLLNKVFIHNFIQLN